jgi:hypothetical protein
MNDFFSLQPGEKQVGIVNGWRYVIRCSEGGAMFWVVRRSLSAVDYGRREERLALCDTREEAERVARRTMECSRKAVEASCGW